MLLLLHLCSSNGWYTFSCMQPGKKSIQTETQELTKINFFAQQCVYFQSQWISFKHTPTNWIWWLHSSCHSCSLTISFCTPHTRFQEENTLRWTHSLTHWLKHTPCLSCTDATRISLLHYSAESGVWNQGLLSVRIVQTTIMLWLSYWQQPARCSTKRFLSCIKVFHTLQPA